MIVSSVLRCAIPMMTQWPRSLMPDAEENRLKLEIQLADVAAAQVAKLLAKQVAVESVATMA